MNLEYFLKTGLAITGSFLLLILLGSLYFLSNNLNIYFSEKNIQESLTNSVNVSVPTVSFSYLTIEDYKKLIENVKVPNIDIRADQSLTITISSKRIDNISDWNWAIASVIQQRNGIVWETESLCLGNCSSDKLNIVLKGKQIKSN